MNQLEKYKGFKAELAIAETFEELKFIESKAAAAAEFAKKNKIGLDEQNQWGEFRVEIEAKKGAWLDKQFPRKGTGANQYKSAELPKSKLSSMPVTPKESSNARIVHREPELRKEVINELKKNEQVVTPHAVSSGIRKKQKEITHKNLPIPKPIKGKYRVFYADPPWCYGDKQDTELLGGAEKHYPTMTIQELCELPIKSLTEENAVLFLWVTSPLLEECFEVIKAWGFKYKTSFIWDKIKHNMGHYNSVRHELLLVCTKGSCLPDNKKLYDSVQSIERSKRHSEKPEEFREIIDTIYSEGRRVELFAREEHPNWKTWGNEI